MRRAQPRASGAPVSLTAANIWLTARLLIGVTKHVPVIVIVGGGFGGLAAARALKHTPARIILIDRTNHHLFQPLLYQVATSVLTPSQIASPIRGIVRKQRNITVLLGEVTGVDQATTCVLVSDADRANVPVPYDYLILATPATHSYFGHDEFGSMPLG